MDLWDVIIVGAGPAGSACAAICAKNGLRTLVLERAVFPREKVCGDCVNPGCWPYFQQLGVADAVRSLPHAEIECVEFRAGKGSPVAIPLPRSGTSPEIAVKRSLLDNLLVQNAQAVGARVLMNSPVTALTQAAREARWQVRCQDETYTARHLVAADGRNSTVARILGLLPAAQPDRIGVQLHFPLPKALRRRVRMQFLPEGYCGVADAGGGDANLCLVALPPKIEALKAWAVAEFGLAASATWRVITPLQRAPAQAQEGVLLVGDAARVVEPFTGEGIYYALASGVLAARCLASNSTEAYAVDHARLYRGRLWVNEVARYACLHPNAARLLFAASRRVPGILSLLTRKVVRAH